jgi:hypothetical protein
MLASTVGRVPQHTAEEINERIRRQTAESVARHADAGDAAIGRRLGELDQEWDIERTLEANAASVALLGLGLGALVHRRFFALPALVAGFLLQHALQGWCPPVPIFRRLGFRTQPEIEQERYALKALRGDFGAISGAAAALPGDTRAQQALEAARR